MRKPKRSIYDEFAQEYVGMFMDAMAEGAGGGLYDDSISVRKGHEGRFGAKDVVKFIRFQHGDNDYDHSFSPREDEELRENVSLTAMALLKAVKGDGWDRDNWSPQIPYLEANVVKSLEKIARRTT